MFNLVEFEVEAAKPTSNIHSHDDIQVAALTLQAELFQWHYCLGHLSFSKLQLLSALGILPRKLTNVKPPKYMGCIL
eukprot:12755919-Ditylum_brightwellii.AAC.1